MSSQETTSLAEIFGFFSSAFNVITALEKSALLPSAVKAAKVPEAAPISHDKEMITLISKLTTCLGNNDYESFRATIRDAAKETPSDAAVSGVTVNTTIKVLGGISKDYPGSTSLFTAILDGVKAQINAQAEQTVKAAEPSQTGKAGTSDQGEADTAAKVTEAAEADSIRRIIVDPESTSSDLITAFKYACRKTDAGLMGTILNHPDFYPGDAVKEPQLNDLMAAAKELGSSSRKVASVICQDEVMLKVMNATFIYFDDFWLEQLNAAIVNNRASVVKLLLSKPPLSSSIDFGGALDKAFKVGLPDVAKAVVLAHTLSSEQVGIYLPMAAKNGWTSVISAIINQLERLE